DFMRFLFRWQHLAHGTKLHGKPGLRHIIQQLQGFELPSAAWERAILSSRMGKYDPSWLDSLCLSGEVAWGRLSIPQRTNGEEPRRRRVGPTRAAPLGLVLREDLSWLLEPCEDPAGRADLSHAGAAVYETLVGRGAQFFLDLVAGSKRLRTEVEDGLGECIS